MQVYLLNKYKRRDFRRSRWRKFLKILGYMDAYYLKLLSTAWKESFFSSLSPLCLVFQTMVIPNFCHFLNVNVTGQKKIYFQIFGIDAIP